MDNAVLMKLETSPIGLLVSPLLFITFLKSIVLSSSSMASKSMLSFPVLSFIYFKVLEKVSKIISCNDSVPVISLNSVLEISLLANFFAKACSSGVLSNGLVHLILLTNALSEFLRSNLNNSLIGPVIGL
ncbi:hypothetical protein U3516DRAFT_895949 [Neocallimastix sp. 'constans']